jgi:hypothetical protein
MFIPHSYHAFPQRLQHLEVLGAGSGEEVVGEDAGCDRPEAVRIDVLVKVFAGWIEDIDEAGEDQVLPL